MVVMEKELGTVLPHQYVRRLVRVFTASVYIPTKQTAPLVILVLGLAVESVKADPVSQLSLVARTQPLLITTQQPLWMTVPAQHTYAVQQILVSHLTVVRKRMILLLVRSVPTLPVLSPVIAHCAAQLRAALAQSMVA